MWQHVDYIKQLISAFPMVQIYYLVYVVTSQTIAWDKDHANDFVKEILKLVYCCRC